jgi:Ras homolog enriched in brain
MTSTTINNNNNNNNATNINTNNNKISNINTIKQGGITGRGGGGGAVGGARGGGGNNNSNSNLMDTNTLTQNNNNNNNNNNSQPTLVHRKVAILGWKNVGKSSLVHSFVTGTFVPTTTTTTTTLSNNNNNNHGTTTTTTATTTSTTSTDPNKTTTNNVASTVSSSSIIEETTYTKTIRFRKVHFHTDIVDTAGMSTMTDEPLYHFNDSLHQQQQQQQQQQHMGFSTLWQHRWSRNASLGVHGYVLVFSLVSRQSFEQVQRVNTSLLQTLGNAPDTSAAAPPRVLVGTMLDLATTLNSSHSQHQQRQQQQQRQVSMAEAQALALSWKSGQGVPYIECSSKTGEGVAEVFHTLLKEIEKDDGLLLFGGSDESSYYYGPSSCVLV